MLTNLSKTSSSNFSNSVGSLQKLTVAIASVLAMSVSYAQTAPSVDNSNPTNIRQIIADSEQGLGDQTSAEQSNPNQANPDQTEAESPESTENDNLAATTANTKADTDAKTSTETTQSSANSQSKNNANLSSTAQKVNNSNWQPGEKITQTVGTKLQALLNWNNHGVGAVDGLWGKNTQKAMQAFQQAKGLAVTDNLNQQTWEALQNGGLADKPVLTNYTLTDSDVNIKTTAIPASAEAKGKLEGMYYESVPEALAEKFHMSVKYLKQLNPKASFTAGETLTVYNPGQANSVTVARVVADKDRQTLFAYDKSGKLVASYPTTVGSTAQPSPSGTHKVKTKVSDPNYTYTDSEGKQTIIPPGPNNPVGKVWIGLTKPSYGIHGSPDPERISRQASAGCIRLTNWDALALLKTIESDATVEIK